MRYLGILTAVFALGCSHGGSQPAKQPDGSYQLSCAGPLTDCLRQAEHVCGDEGYTVSAARDARELLGHESGQSQVAIQKSDATVYCGNASSSSTRAIIELKSEPVTRAPAKEPPPLAPKAEPLPAPASAPTPACVPGATQACVGPGGCAGGQACASDGSHFERCDCAR